MIRTGLIAVMALIALACGGGVDSSAGSNAVPVGAAVSVAGWDVRVVGSRADGVTTGSERESYDVQLFVRFSGDGTTTIANDIELSAVAASGDRYPADFSDCQGGLAVDRPLQPDQSIEGFVCFTVDREDAIGLQLVLTPKEGGGPTVAMETVTPGGPADDDFGPERAVTALIDAGVDAELVDSPYARSGIIPGYANQYVLCLDGQESQLYEYATEQLREAESSRILPDGNTRGSYTDLYYGRLMWWATGRVLVNYNFADPGLSEKLTTALGETISPAGTEFADPPDPLPPSELCNGETG